MHQAATGADDGGHGLRQEAGMDRTAKLSRKFSGSARFRVLIDRAQQALDGKNALYREQRAIREHLVRLVRMLDAATLDDAHISLLHELALRTVSVPAPPSKPDDALTVSASSLALESLPTSIADYTDSLMERISHLQLGDFVALFRTWSGRISTMLVHVGCHGAQSHFAAQFEEAVLQFAVFHTIHAWTQPHQQVAVGSINMLTGQPAQAPEGWYERVAQQLPVDKEFALLVKTGLDFIHSCEEPVLPQRSSCTEAIVTALSQPVEAHGQATKEHLALVELESLLDKYLQISHSAMRHRVMVATYLFTNMWNRFGPSTMAQLMCNCWPFSIRGMIIFDAYLQRPEVVQLLSDADHTVSEAVAEAIAGSVPAADAAGTSKGTGVRSADAGPDLAATGGKDAAEAAAAAGAAAAPTRGRQVGAAQEATRHMLGAAPLSSRRPTGAGSGQGAQQLAGADDGKPLPDTPSKHSARQHSTSGRASSRPSSGEQAGPSASKLQQAGTAAAAAPAAGTAKQASEDARLAVRQDAAAALTAGAASTSGSGAGLMTPAGVLLQGFTLELAPGSSAAGNQGMNTDLAASGYQNLGLTHPLELGAAGGMLQLSLAGTQLGGLLQQQLWNSTTGLGTSMSGINAAMHSMAAPQSAGARQSQALPQGGVGSVLHPSWQAGFSNLDALRGLQLPMDMPGNSFGAGATPLQPGRASGQKLRDSHTPGAAQGHPGALGMARGAAEQHRKDAEQREGS